ncbi:MAG: HEAT repeat domain-containing protein, partial [Planctomycetota bacterium]|nr:HEAT repeat domain-containing protein [Planctomycetota bacterium]
TCAIFDRVGGRCDALVHWVHGATYAEPLKVPTLKQTGYYLPAARRWGQVAPAGLVRYRGTHFGEDYHENLFACQFNTHQVVRIRLQREGATWRGTDEVFLRSPGVDFHPADVLEDADGSLLVIDTGNWLTMGCPASTVGTQEVCGGIYRVRKIDGAVPPDPRGLKLHWSDATTAELAGRLDDTRTSISDYAMEALVRRADEAVPVLERTLQPPSSSLLRRNAVWTLARIGSPAARSLLCRTLADADSSVRQTAVHSLGTLREADAVDHLMKLVVEDELPIRREAATALGLIGEHRAVPALFASLSSARDEFLEHALIYALIEIQNPVQTRLGLTHPAPQVQRAALLALDQMEAGELTREDVAPLLAAADIDLQRAALDVIGKHPTWGDEIVELLEAALRVAQPTPAHNALISGAVPAFTQNARVQSLVAETLESSARPPARLGLLEAIAKADVEQLPQAWVTPLSTLCLDPDEQVRRQAVVTIAAFNVEPFVTPLFSLARDTTQPKSLRVAALAAVARRDVVIEESDLGLLMDQLQTDVAPIDRLAAADALGRAALSAKQLTSLLPLIEQAGPLELPALLRAFENAARSQRLTNEELREPGLKFMAALAKSPGLTALPAARVQAVADLYPPEVATALNRLLPRLAVDNQEQRTRIAEIETQIATGNPELGRHTFLSQRAACSVCHRIAGNGGQIGPDLTRIGQVRTTRDLTEAVLFPSATLASGFETYTVATQSGEVRTGLIRRETADAIHLVTIERVDVRVRRTEIDELAPSAVSVMPQGLDKLLTQEELVNVVSFLKTLK